MGMQLPMTWLILNNLIVVVVVVVDDDVFETCPEWMS